MALQLDSVEFLVEFRHSCNFTNKNASAKFYLGKNQVGTRGFLVRCPVFWRVLVRCTSALECFACCPSVLVCNGKAPSVLECFGEALQCFGVFWWVHCFSALTCSGALA